jgi:hypothetical protein
LRFEQTILSQYLEDIGVAFLAFGLDIVQDLFNSSVSWFEEVTLSVSQQHLVQSQVASFVVLVDEDTQEYRTEQNIQLRDE